MVRRERKREQTRVKDVLVTIKNKWVPASHIMLRTYNRWAKRVT